VIRLVDYIADGPRQHYFPWKMVILFSKCLIPNTLFVISNATGTASSKSICHFKTIQITSGARDSILG
jgi:hypothetical protein